jgi:ribosomal protein L11 methyltransferase
MPFADYIQYKITARGIVAEIGTEIVPEERLDIIISELSDMPFESFETGNEYILAYVQAEQDDDTLEELIKNIPGVSAVEKKRIKGENWNKIWEESFDPITIDEQVIVRAPFHIVEKSFEHEIIIEPKMSFGTGHHATTRLMMESMLPLNFENKSVLDMGCGTGILAILAVKLGAAKVLAVDHDPQCIENTRENIALNNCQLIEVCQNDEISANFKTDIILANIQKNVLLEQMSLYKHWLNTRGNLLVSGIYEEAVKDIIASAEKNGLSMVTYKILNEWCMIHFEN